MTCLCHRSIKEDGQERKCKKELSVTKKHPEEVVVRILAWWLAEGFLVKQQDGCCRLLAICCRCKSFTLAVASCILPYACLPFVFHTDAGAA